jgi:iron complex outermembrane receptor protein
MQRMSANGAGTITNNWNTGFNFASGATAPALRGLTVQSTLSMADGLRLAPYPLADDGQRNFVDLNTIPSAIVDRIEVLRDGASSTYGADAIAGVVNVITKKEVQGLHIGASTGTSQEGGGDENRFDITWGTGDLESDGHNFYVSAEYLHMNRLTRQDRAGTNYATSDWTNVCNSDGSCMANGNWNSITEEDGSFFGSIDVPGVAMVRPVAAGEGNGYGNLEFLNQAAGCREWPEVVVPPGVSGTSPPINCEVNYWGVYSDFQPDIMRKGITLRYTANLSDDSQFYAMANFYRTDTNSNYVPQNFDRGMVNPQGATYQGAYQVLLPVYVCAGGVGTFDGENTGCDATNGILNPYNPYAATGERAQMEFRSPIARKTSTESRVSRVALGLDGSFGNDWRYGTAFTASEVNLERTQAGDYIPGRIMDVVAQGTFNFAEPLDTPQEIWDYISPDSVVTSPSRLWMVEATLAKDLVEMGGGPLQAAVGISYRDESINAPSANPANDRNPYDRYLSMNAVGTKGARDVSSMFFEIDAPFTESFDVVASGRYDDYSTGQDSFSPKVGFKWQLLDSLALRGTWSQGFRIPSFNESFGLPTTGFVTRIVDCVAYQAFCDSHNNNSYATDSYSLGLTNVGDPTLDPEESESFTAGIIWNATDNLSITLDYWNIEVEGLITGVTSTSEAEDQYYSNNGVVDIPGVRVIQGAADAENPNALPLIGSVQSSYQNQDLQEVSGIDLAVTLNIPFSRMDWVSAFEVSYLDKYTLTTDGGDVLEYAGTLSPCNITSCSGAPDYRGSWQNTLMFNDDKTTVALTIYYTAGMDSASIDYGGVEGDCAGNAAIGASTASYVDGTPVNCNSSSLVNTDLTVHHQLNDQVRLFVDVMNLLDEDPGFDPSAAYGLFGFNPAWAGPQIMGRYFRLGAKLDFE